MTLTHAIQEHVFVEREDETVDIGPAVVFTDKSDGARAIVPFSAQLLEDADIDVMEHARPMAEEAIRNLRSGEPPH